MNFVPNTSSSIASNFNILKTEIIFVQAGLSWSFRNQLNCEMDYRMLKSKVFKYAK